MNSLNILAKIGMRTIPIQDEMISRIVQNNADISHGVLIQYRLLTEETIDPDLWCKFKPLYDKDGVVSGAPIDTLNDVLAATYYICESADMFVRSGTMGQNTTVIMQHVYNVLYQYFGNMNETQPTSFGIDCIEWRCEALLEETK